MRSSADLVVLDLEDSILPDDKGAARSAAGAALAARPEGQPCAVRINALNTEYAPADLEMVYDCRPDAIVVPMAEFSGLVEMDRKELPVIPIVETPLGLRGSAQLAEIEGTWAMILGGVDLSRLLRLSPTPAGQELLFARSKLVLDSACAGIAPPIDVVHTNVYADGELMAAARFAKALGFGGKACIHPNQVAIVQSAFAPSADELEWAKRVVAAFAAAQEDGRGVAALEGELVERPVYDQALALIENERDTTQDA